MASASERYIPHDQIWFDASNPGPLHDALRADYARTLAAVERRPSLRRHLGSCETCQAITAAAAEAPAPHAGRRRIKLMINTEQMHQLLRLPPSFEIVHMFASADPNAVSVLVAGEGLPQADPNQEAPIMPLHVIQRATDTAS